MPIDTTAILALPLKERLELAEQLWGSIEEEAHQDTSFDIEFAKHRLALHMQEPAVGYSLEQLKKYFKDKHEL